MRVHGAVANLIHGWRRCAGYSAQREAVVPEWAQWSVDQNGRSKCGEAILDVVATKPFSADELYVDATILNPLTEKYLRRPEVHCKNMSEPPKADVIR